MRIRHFDNFDISLFTILLSQFTYNMSESEDNSCSEDDYTTEEESDINSTDDESSDDGVVQFHG